MATLCRQIIGIGGGEITKPTIPCPIRRYIIKVVNKKEIIITLLPQARLGSPDYDQYIKDFIKTFSYPYKNYNIKINVIRLYGSVNLDTIKNQMLESDIIYIGGGNTLNMLAIFSAWTIDLILQEAYQKGVIIIGVSAGFVGLFTKCVNHSIKDGKLLDGIGLLHGFGLAHYNTKLSAKDTFLNTIRKDKEQYTVLAYGLSEHTAIHFINENINKCLVWSSIDKQSKSNQNKIVCVINSIEEHPIECEPIEYPICESCEIIQCDGSKRCKIHHNDGSNIHCSRCYPIKHLDTDIIRKI